MATIKRFQDLQCWKTARVLTASIYKIDGKLSSDYGLKDQLRRASLSIMNNIAEGFTRFSIKEKIRFLEIAQSSASEVESMLYVLDDLDYLNDEQLTTLRSLLISSRKQTWAFIKYLRTQ